MGSKWSFTIPLNLGSITGRRFKCRLLPVNFNKHGEMVLGDTREKDKTLEEPHSFLDGFLLPDNNISSIPLPHHRIIIIQHYFREFKEKSTL